MTLPDISTPKNLRLTLDYAEDLQFAKIIHEKLGNSFTFLEIIQLLKTNPELIEITNPLIDKWKKNYDDNFLKS